MLMYFAIKHIKKNNREVFMNKNKVKFFLTLLASTVFLHSLAVVYAMVESDIEEKGNSPSLPHKGPSNTAPINKSLVPKEDEVSFKKALQAFKELRTYHPQLNSLKENKPEIIFIYSWGDKEQENLIRLLSKLEY